MAGDDIEAMLLLSTAGTTMDSTESVFGMIIAGMLLTDAALLAASAMNAISKSRLQGMLRAAAACWTAAVVVNNGADFVCTDEGAGATKLLLENPKLMSKSEGPIIVALKDSRSRRGESSRAENGLEASEASSPDKMPNWKSDANHSSKPLLPSVGRAEAMLTSGSVLPLLRGAKGVAFLLTVICTEGKKLNHGYYPMSAIKMIKIKKSRHRR